ncbi:MAG TPA: M56 family metallopeptidase [Actinophytocola sp.]|uniref:M56 family metallopeptidase n=1 Tax=Actinophytocola sp. TaxID=1872138 RepID=UPI002DFF4E7D|nr:M56 family metallopeptidase [Actinophytocola sp.]
MIAAIAMLLAAFAVGVGAPRLLRRIDATRADPLPLLAAWLLSVVGVLAAIVGAIVLLLVPDHGQAAAHLRWRPVAHGAPPHAEELAGMLGAALLLALAARFVVIIARTTRRRARVSREHLAVLRVGACRDAAGTLWLHHDRPLAFSLAGRPGMVVATEGLTRHLRAAEVGAVLAHERAHLRGRHHALITWVDAVTATLPFLPLFRDAPVAVRVLVELCADVAAARRYGVEALRSALISVTAQGAPGGALAMTRDGIELRLARLRHGPVVAGPVRRAVWCGLAAATAVLLPILTAVSLLHAIALAFHRLSG